MNKKVFLPALFLGLIILIGPSGCNKTVSVESENQYVRTDGNKFIDPGGRHIILHGINLVNKNPEENYLGNETAEVFANMKTWGFNCIRLGIIWDGLEPEPGKFDEKYLQGIDQRIAWAADNGIFVFLDMHQDLYSVKYSDGAPGWATLDEGKPHETGDVWSDSYLISPAVQTAFDNFWKNTPVRDGIGVQDHYANAWRYLAERYAANTNVIGYDIMNEPFPGSSASMAMPAILQQYGMIMAEETGVVPTEEELIMKWGSIEQRVKVLEELTDIKKYARILEGIKPISQEFEKTNLVDMYNKITKVIREVDQNHIIFIEHSYFSNMGIETGIQVPVCNDGIKDPLVAYAGHGYDLVVDTKESSNSSFERVGYIFDQINKSAERLQVPLLVGEWGAYYNNLNTLDDGLFVVGKFEEYLASDTYWSYVPGIEDFDYFDILKRHIPSAVSGTLLSYSFDHEKRTFYCQWEENPDITANTEIYIPDTDLISIDQVSVSPRNDKIVINRIRDSQSGYLVIPSTGEKVTRTLNFQLKY